MKLIIGGAYQGKRQYALEHYKGEKIIGEFHLFILELIKKGVEPMKYVTEHINEYTDTVIIADDISCGIVPEEPLMREWREAAGRTLAFIAAEADEVVRVFCGLGIRLK